MIARAGLRARAAVLAAVLVAALPGAAAAAPWSEVFAGDTTAVLFLAADGGLWRAPFDLSAREVVWQPAGKDHLVRVRVSGDGRQYAWLARANDPDTTRLWTAGEGEPATARVRFFSLLPSHFNRQVYVADRPTLEDPRFHGARFVQPDLTMRRYSSNLLEWTPDEASVLFGYSEGLATVPVREGPATMVSPSLVADLVPLAPSPLYLADMIVVTHTGAYGGRRVLLYPAPERWRVFDAGSFAPNDPWTASAGTVWWAKRRAIRAVRTHDPTETTEVEARSTVRWLEYDPVRGAIAWTAGRDLSRRPEEPGPVTVIRRASDAIRAVLVPERGTRRGLVAGDSLLVWDRADDSVRAVALGGLEPAAMLEAADGRLIVSGRLGRDKTTWLARVALEAGGLESIPGPDLKQAIAVLDPTGRKLLLLRPRGDPPGSLQVLDLATGVWEEADNPGIVGWELLGGS